MLAKGAIGIGVILATFVGPAGMANAQTLLEQSAEVRMQLDLAGLQRRRSRRCCPTAGSRSWRPPAPPRIAMCA